jgi:hypothetical protein
MSDASGTEFQYCLLGENSREDWELITEDVRLFFQDKLERLDPDVRSALACERIGPFALSEYTDDDDTYNWVHMVLESRGAPLTRDEWRELIAKPV